MQCSLQKPPETVRALLSQVKGSAKLPVRKTREAGFLPTAFEILKAQISEVFKGNTFLEQTLGTGIFADFAYPVQPVRILILSTKADFMK